MPNTKFLFAAVFFIFLSLEGIGQQKYSFTRQKMGSPFTIVVYSDDAEYVDSVVEKVFDEVDRLNLVFSDYFDSSELMRLSKRSGKRGSTRVSADLFDILKTSYNASLMSNGSFDVTVGPLSVIWRKARKSSDLPRKPEVSGALKKVGYQFIVLDSANHSVRLKKKGMRLDLGGIAKGYIAQRALDLLKNAGLSSSLVNAGGDMVVGAPPPNRGTWKVGITLPDSADKLMKENVLISDKAVATSGDLYQFLIEGGHRYSHIIDPKTGWGVQHHRNVTVIADDGATADWVASACSVMEIDQVKIFLKKIPEVSVLITERVDGKLSKIFLNDFEAFLQPGLSLSGLNEIN